MFWSSVPLIRWWSSGLMVGSNRERPYSSLTCIVFGSLGNRGVYGFRCSLKGCVILPPRSSRLLIASSSCNGRDACERRRLMSSMMTPPRYRRNMVIRRRRSSGVIVSSSNSWATDSRMFFGFLRSSSKPVARVCSTEAISMRWFFSKMFMHSCAIVR